MEEAVANSVDRRLSSKAEKCAAYKKADDKPLQECVGVLIY